MARAQDRNAGLQSGSQEAERAARTSGPGTSSGAVSTGGTGTTSGTTTTTTGTTTTVRERQGYQQDYPQGGYQQQQRGMAPTTGREAGGREELGIHAGGVFPVLAGVLTFLFGLGMVVRQHFFFARANYPYHFSSFGWGWILLVLGVLLFAAGASHMLGVPFGRTVAIGLAVLVAIAGFLALIYSPIWGIIIVGLAALAIGGLLRGEHRAL
jgi:hypothetical protein